MEASMRVAIRSMAVVAWLVLLGTGAGTRNVAGGGWQSERGEECFEIDGVIYCPCDESRTECMSPECVLMVGGWYCPRD
jgi:hypothetical protein